MSPLVNIIILVSFNIGLTLSLNLQDALSIIDEIEATECVHLYLDNRGEDDKTHLDWKLAYNDMRTLYQYTNNISASGKVTGSHYFLYTMFALLSVNQKFPVSPLWKTLCIKSFQISLS